MSTGANPLTTISGQSSAGNYGFVDPSGTVAPLQNALYGAGGAVSGGPMGTYNANANGIMSQVAGLSGPLQGTLSGIANYQANNALNAVGSNFSNQGALGSGAAAQAFGQAIANPFANAQAQLQQGQLSAASGALNNLMGVSGGAYNSGMTNASNLMEHTSGLVAPTYMTNPDYTAQQQGKQNLYQLLNPASNGGSQVGGAALGGLLSSGAGAAALA